ncbi:MAG: DUF6448 family protein [Candidatus Methanoperedens sp.]|nr:DUF6448 family protein [Candidatus Methanoperedens sp.]
MPPHCDTMDGPVVKTSKIALETGNVNLILPWVPEKGEEEVQKRFRYATSLKKYEENDVNAAREYVRAMLGFMLYSHKLYMYMKSAGGHATEATGGHEH